MSKLNFAIRYEPDGYLTSGQKLMGRQAAGAGFLRAAVQNSKDQPLICYSPASATFATFQRQVHAWNDRAATRWIATDRLDQLSQVGTLYLPGPNLAEAARHRLRASASAYSIFGVTHTTASHGAMDMIADLVTGPVMPWDALICTSSAVLTTVRQILAEEQSYLERRFQIKLKFTEPQLPVIPLGVHCDDFAFSEQERRAARASLGIPADAVVVLFVGRLSFHAKAHPHAMYVALEEVARTSRQPVVLLQTGWFANEMIQTAFVEGAATYMPSVAAMFADGRNPNVLHQSWAAGDIFVSLSDNVQETFGLTPVEAMAAGLPVVVTDWDGYRDTVEDGVHGYRIPTWMPAEGVGQRLAARYEAGVESYDRYCGLSAQQVSLDARALRDALHELIGKPDLRAALGEAGRLHARQHFDWLVIFRRYQDLLTQLQRIRQELSVAGVERFGTGRSSSRRMDPYITFSHYATERVDANTEVEWESSITLGEFQRLREGPLWRATADELPKDELIARMLAGGCGNVGNLAAKLGVNASLVIEAVTALAKMGLVRFKAAALRDPLS